MSKFGLNFERYICKLVEMSCCYRDIYDYIPEFEYGKNKKKSPDAMIYNKNKNSILVIEAKSARVLNSMLMEDDENYSFKKSVDKLMIKPWEQAFNSICDIVERNIDLRFSEKSTFFFVCVSMNDIAMPPLDIKINQQGNDITQYFFSMNIEAFEIFMEILSSDSDFCFGSILLGFLNHKSKMSMKTYLSRIRDHENLVNEQFKDNIRSSLNSVLEYINQPSLVVS